MSPWEQATLGNRAIEDEISVRVVGTLLPALKEARRQLLDVQELWLANGMQEKVAAVLQSGATIAGYPAQDWYDWGVVLVEQLAFLNEQIAAIQKTPLQVMLKWYKKNESE